MSPDTKSELRIMLRLARPLVAGQVMLFSTNVVDTLLAGHLGPEVLGAVAIGSSVWMVPLMLLQGLMFTVPAKVSHLIGAGQRLHVGVVFRQAMYLAAGTGLLITFSILLLARPLAGLLRLELGHG